MKQNSNSTKAKLTNSTPTQPKLSVKKISPIRNSVKIGSFSKPSSSNTPIRVSKPSIQGVRGASSSIRHVTASTARNIHANSKNIVFSRRTLAQSQRPSINKSNNRSITRRTTIDPNRKVNMSRIREKGKFFEKKANNTLQKIFGENIGTQINVMKDNKKRFIIDNVIFDNNKNKRPIRAVSVKNTNWHKIQDRTWRRYINQVANYKGSIIKSRKENISHINGSRIQAKPILVIPKQHTSSTSIDILKKIKNYAHSKGVHIQLH